MLSSRERVWLGNVLAVPEALMFPVTVNEVPVAAPILGVTRVGVFAKTNEPVPVSSVTAAAKLALVGVARNVATFDAGL